MVLVSVIICGEVAVLYCVGVQLCHCGKGANLMLYTVLRRCACEDRETIKTETDYIIGESSTPGDTPKPLIQDYQIMVTFIWGVLCS